MSFVPHSENCKRVEVPSLRSSPYCTATSQLESSVEKKRTTYSRPVLVISVIGIVSVGESDPSRLHFGGRRVGESTEDGEQITRMETLLGSVVSKEVELRTKLSESRRDSLREREGFGRLARRTTRPAGYPWRRRGTLVEDCKERKVVSEFRGEQKRMRLTLGRQHHYRTATDDQHRCQGRRRAKEKLTQ